MFNALIAMLPQKRLQRLHSLRRQQSIAIIIIVVIIIPILAVIIVVIIVIVIIDLAEGEEHFVRHYCDVSI